MKKWIFFGVGVAVGAAVTFLAVKKHYEQIAYTEINEYREVCKRKMAAKDLADKNRESKDILLKEITENGDSYEKAQEAVKKYLGENEKFPKKSDKTGKLTPKSASFNVFSNPPDADELDLEEDEDDITEDPYEFIVDQTGPVEEYSEGPILISEDEFSSEKLFYSKVLIELYDDGVAVLEENDEILDEPIEAYVGPDILQNAQPDQDGMIYVRNHSRSTDYGIIFTGCDFVSEEGPD